jgi:MFS family permease
VTRSSQQRRRLGSPLRRSLRASTLDGSLHAGMVGFGEIYFPAFALSLGATPIQVAMLATAPLLAGSVFQLLSPHLANWMGNKRWVVISATLQALLFVPIGALALGSETSPQSYERLLFLVCVYWMLALGVNPPWNAWMARLVPKSVRPRYFSRRNVPIHAVSFASVLAGGGIIHFAQVLDWGADRGFLVAFLLAGSCRLASAWFLSRQIEPRYFSAAPREPLPEVIGESSKLPYGRLILLLTVMAGSSHVAVPYFTPFMLQDLALSYAQFTILNGAVVLTRILSSSYWGEVAHSYGNRRALQAAALLVAPLPGLWVVSGRFDYLLGLQLMAGFAWAGFELAAFLNLFDCTNDRNRAQVLSLYNLANGVAIVAGTVAGGIVLQHFGPAGYGHVFVVSSILRGLTVLLFAKGVGVKREHEHSFHNVFLRVISLRPGQGANVRPMVMDEESDDRTEREAS